VSPQLAIFRRRDEGRAHEVVHRKGKSYAGSSLWTFFARFASR
jgi:hypothetical protein